MELRYLKTFYTVATLGSFYRAAEVLSYAQSTVSDQIKTLESDLEVTLFKRAGNQLSLTSAGERLLQYAPQMLNLEDEIRLEVSRASTMSGTLSMRVPETVSSYYLLPILEEFHQRFPHVNFSFNPCAYFGLVEELHAGMINLAFLLTDEFRAAGVEVEPLMTIPVTIVTASDHRLARLSQFELSDLKNEPVLIPTSDCSYIQMLEKILTAEKMEITQVWRLNTLSAIKQVLFSGTGVTVLPLVAVKQELDEGRLTVLPWQPLQAKLFMIWQKNLWQPPMLEAFMALIREAFTTE